MKNNILLFIISILLFSACNNNVEETNIPNSNSNNRAVKDVTLQFYNQCIEKGDENKFLCLYDRAEYYFKNKEYSLSLKDFMECIKIPETKNEALDIRSNSYWHMAIIYSKLDKNIEARDNYLEALALKKEAMIYNNLGLVEIYLEDYDNALLHINKALELNLKESYAYNNKAYALLKKGELEEAKKNLDIAEKMNFKNPYLLKNIAMYYSLKKDDSNACRYINKAFDFGFPESANKLEKEEYELIKKENCK